MSQTSIVQFKKYFLIVLFCLIILCAHPTKATSPIVNGLWPLLHTAGLDVYMKPFTGDMIFMYDSQLKQSLYKYDLDITYFTPNGAIQIDVRDLSFHRFRVPFTWFGIAAIQEDELSPYIETLCKELKRTHGEGDKFIINSNSPNKVSQKYGMNKPFSCQ